MANISSLLNTIKNAIYGRDMRSALRDSIKAVNDDTETRLSRNGGTMTGGITMNGNKVTSSATPSTDNDYTNKKYVDAKDKEVASYSNSDYPECTTVKSALDKTFEKFAEKGKPNGYAGLDKDGKIPTEQLPPITKSDVGLGNVDNTADSTKKVLSASKLTTPRTINGVSFDGSANITIKDDTKEPKITAGTSSQMWIGTKKWVSILTTVQSVLLTGLSTATNSAITASDTIIKAFGKLQAQINARLPLKGGIMTGDIVMNENKITSSAVPSDAYDHTNKQYVDDAIANAIANATMLECEINDSDGGTLLDGTGQSILGRVNVINVITDINETIEKLKQHAILDSTF